MVRRAWASSGVESAWALALRMGLSLTALVTSAAEAQSFSQTFEAATCNGGGLADDVVGDESPARIDVVGDATHAAALYANDASFYYMRQRIAADPTGPGGYASHAWSWGIDTDGNEANGFELVASLDGVPELVKLLPAGSATPLWSASTSTHAHAVAAGSSVGGGTDWFLTIAVPIPDLNDAGASGSLKIWLGSSANASGIDKDWACFAGLPSSAADVLVDPVNVPTQCTSDTDCGGTTPICDPGDGLCVACSTDAQCMAIDANTPVCGASGACDPCSTNAECAAINPATPICSAGGACIPGCLNDGDCTAPGFPRCDLGTNQCVECLDDVDCASGVCDLNEAPPVCEASNVCGNGAVEMGESCDDGNTVSGDGCNGSCLKEIGETCGASMECASGVCDAAEDPDVCEPANTCGNSNLEGAEGCDDGNTTSGDGCDGGCLKELGQSCSAGAECASGICDMLGSNTCESADACGNGTVEMGESCDDGNTVDGDGCNGVCLREEGSACMVGSECATGLCDAGGLGCVACFDDQSGVIADSGCNGIAPYCATSGMFPFCTAGCSDSGVGGTDAGCAGTDNACDVSGSNPVCVDCTDTADCSVGNACDVTTNSCVAGCFSDADCAAATEPVCDTSTSTPGSCVTCINDQPAASADAGCTNPTLPLCNGAVGSAGTECALCLDDMTGTAIDTGCSSDAALCDSAVEGGACVGCFGAADCPGLQICTPGQTCGYPDTNGDGLTDQLDTDDDGDGIPDAEEGAGRDVSIDTDDDGVPDYADPDEVSCTDADADGICDVLPSSVDTDGDQIPNHLDLDSDGDGVPDATEGHDADGDGMADAIPSGNDNDNDGLDDAFDPDCSGMPSGCAADGLPAAAQDRDGDGTPDYLDADSDNDGLLDRVEAFDANGDGAPEAFPSGVDADGNGLDDAFDVGQGGIVPTGQDTDGDSRPDYLDQDSDGDGIADGAECPDATACPDTDGDGRPDALDTDSDDDGIPDSSEGHDGNADGAPDFAPLGMDDDADGLDDAYDIDMAGAVPAPLPDRDGDGTPDFRDPDDDGDGVDSALECVDPMAGCADSDGDGAPDYLDPSQSPVDTDGDGIPDAAECGGDIQGCQDTDGDGAPDHLDPDDDGDGIDTADEIAASNQLGNDDVDDDGEVNWLDTDSDGDGIADGDQALDADSNGVPDYLETGGQTPPFGGLRLEGGGGVEGCHVQMTGRKNPAGVLILSMLALSLSIRRHRRKPRSRGA